MQYPEPRCSLCHGALTGRVWGTHRQARVALGPWWPHGTGAIQCGAARLALLALGTCLPLVTLWDRVSLGGVAREPRMAGDPSSRHGEKALPAGWRRSGSGRRGTGLGRQRAAAVWARAACRPPLPGGMCHSPGGPGAPTSPFSPFCPGNWWKPAKSTRAMPSQRRSVKATALTEGPFAGVPGPLGGAGAQTPPYLGRPAVQDGWHR